MSVRTKKEIPGIIPDFLGMRKYLGYQKNRCRYHVYLPTTIFDPKAAIIRVYELEDLSKQSPDSPETIVQEEWVKLNSLPTWNVEYQCLQLSSRDERNVWQALRNLERELES